MALMRHPGKSGASRIPQGARFVWWVVTVGGLHGRVEEARAMTACVSPSSDPALGKRQGKRQQSGNVSDSECLPNAANSKTIGKRI